jgi:hypothetical protein
MNKRHLNQHVKKLLTAMSIAAFSALSSLAIAQQAPDVETDASALAQQAPDAADADSSVRLEARLQPVIPVDASGQARLDIEAGTANDRFTAEVEIAKADFADLGITRGNGFQDEVVQLRVLRGGVLIFSNRLQFSRNLVNDITFETDIRGTAAPELRAGDVARVSVNGHFTLRGRFQLPLISVTSNSMGEVGTISRPLFSPNTVPGATLESPEAVFAFERACSRRSVVNKIRSSPIALWLA